MRYKLPRLIAIFCLGISLSVAATANAADYYMSPSGSDSNPGTIAAPWKSLDRLQEAQKILKPGDTVYFRGGDYMTGYASNRAYYSWSAKGTSSSPVTYKNYQGETPVIVLDRTAPRENTGTLIFIGSYITIEGLNFRQTEASRSLIQKPDGSIVRNSGIGATALATWGDGVKIRNCSIQGFTLGIGAFGGKNILVERCKVSGTVSHGFYIAAAGGTFRYNELDGSRGYYNQQGIQVQYESAVGNKIYGNLIKNGRASGVVLSGSVSYNEVFNNVFINAGSMPGSFGYALSFWCEKDHEESGGVRPFATARPGNKFYNNTIIGKSNSGVINTSLGTPDGGEYCQKMNGGRSIAENIAIYNNIFYPSSPPATTLKNISTMKNNIFYNIKGSVPSGNTLVNPMLKNPNGNTSEDAMLLEGSPAIDKAPNGAPALDYRSGTRPVVAYADIGAFESGAPPGPGGGPLGSDIGSFPTSVPAPVLLGPNGEVCPSGF
ncbi:MAG: right-handed parallel beta-helix repeat-containing protein [Pseudomonadota bacterium]